MAQVMLSTGPEGRHRPAAAEPAHTKRQAIQHRRLQHRKLAAAHHAPDEANPPFIYTAGCLKSFGDAHEGFPMCAAVMAHAARLSRGRVWHRLLAPLIPFAKQRLEIDDAALGLLLLCIGGGSAIITSSIVLALILPTLTFASTPVTLGAMLFLFGAALGTLDVSVNVHAVEVERAAARPLMSGCHALFSIGGFAGSRLMTVFLSVGVPALAGTLVCCGLMLTTMLVVRPRLLPMVRSRDHAVFAVPRGIVLLHAVLAMTVFLTEGAMLDWGALLVTKKHLAPPQRAGLGYILFATAMIVGRLFGDRLVTHLGDRATLVWGSLCALAGFLLLLLAPPPASLSGFLLIGLGASNIVPVLFRRAGAQTRMPPALAIGAMTTLGYAGILVGPAAIGFAAKATDLTAAFWMLAALMALVPPTARWAGATR